MACPSLLAQAACFLHNHPFDQFYYTAIKLVIRQRAANTTDKLLYLLSSCQLQPICNQLFIINLSAMIRQITILVLLVLSLSFSIHNLNSEENCRFAHDFTTSEIFNNPDKLNDFFRKYIKWQAKFINEVGVDKRTGLTLDGIRVDVKTGELLPESLHKFTASSKESIHLGIMALVLDGAEFVDEIYEPLDVFGLVELKTRALEDFYKRYPGFAGFLPWVTVTDKGVDPTHDFKSRVPALDNGQMFWAALSLSHVWQQKYPNVLPSLRERFDKVYWKGMIQNARRVFFNETTGKIRAVANIADITKSPESNTYTNDDDYYLNDPYEGQLFTWIITLLAKDQFSQKEIDFIWQDKRKMLQPANLYVRGPCVNITVEKGYWFSSHEQWKNLFMPYNESQTYGFIQYNNQLARVWNSFEKNIPGFYGAMAGPAESNTEDTGYFVAGIEELAFQKVQFDKLVTPYGAFPLLLVNREFGAAWLHNTIYSPCGQTKYGALEGTGLNGSLMSPTLTWDTKITTVLAMLNGTRSITKRYLQKNNLLTDFVSILEREYNLAFPNIDGTWMQMILPGWQVSQGRPDFTSCS